MKDRIRFTVTQEHIDAGMPCGGSRCPVALALIATKQVSFVAVGPDDVWLRPAGSGPGAKFRLSRATQRFVAAFDDGRPVHPFTGEVYR